MANQHELMGLLKVNKLTDKEARTLHKNLRTLMKACDDLDGEDAFGTEGWRHLIGWDE